MKRERYLKDREAIIRADIWKEITSSCKSLRTELGYTNIEIVTFLKEITKTFEKLGKDNIGSESFHEFIKKKIRKQKKVEISENIEESQRREIVVFEMPGGETFLGM